MSGPKVDLETVSPNLLTHLRILGNEYGPMGVAMAAASLVGEKAVVRALTPDEVCGVMATPQPDPFDLRETRALDIADIDHLKKTLYSLSNLPAGLDGEMDCFFEGEKIAKVWWNSEKEIWMADYLGSSK